MASPCGRRSIFRLGSRGVSQLAGAALCLLVAARDDLRAVAIIDAFVWVHTPGRFVGGAADQQILGAGDTSSWPFVRTTLKGRSSSGMGGVLLDWNKR
jgi:hypothetical protein